MWRWEESQQENQQTRSKSNTRPALSLGKSNLTLLISGAEIESLLGRRLQPQSIALLIFSFIRHQNSILPR